MRSDKLDFLRREFSMRTYEEFQNYSKHCERKKKEDFAFQDMFGNLIPILHFINQGPNTNNLINCPEDNTTIEAEK